MAMASESFAKGNEAFVEENYEVADQCYTLALGLDESRDDFYAARAHARIKLDRFHDAVADAVKALELNDKNVKALLRKGVALFHLLDFEGAIQSLKLAQSLDESDKNVGTWLKKSESELSRQKKKVQHETDDAKDNMDFADKDAPSAVQVSPITPAALTEIPMPTGPKTRYDWYQTETHVIITIMVKNVKKEDVTTELDDKSVGVSIHLPSGSEYSLNLDLSHTICPPQSSVKIMSTKVEVKLKKVEGFRWMKLEGKCSEEVKQFHPEAASMNVAKYPSSSHHTRDWDKLVSDLKTEEKNEKKEGDAALNDLFQQIYSDGSDEVRKAMNKSFVESGGTVLSTNWKEIAEKKTEVKPPDGMEHKSYSS